MTTHRCGCIDLSPIHTSHTYINRNCTYARHVPHFGASQVREYACVLFLTPDLLQLHPSLVPKVDDSPDCFFAMSCNEIRGVHIQAADFFCTAPMPCTMTLMMLAGKGGFWFLEDSPITGITTGTTQGPVDPV